MVHSLLAGPKSAWEKCVVTWRTDLPERRFWITSVLPTNRTLATQTTSKGLVLLNICKIKRDCSYLPNGILRRSSPATTFGIYFEILQIMRTRSCPNGAAGHSTGRPSSRAGFSLNMRSSS
jgi:hypothetical protein